jgi:hypothetical protein
VEQAGYDMFRSFELSSAGVHFGYPNLGIGSCFVVSYSAALLLPIYDLESHSVDNILG